MVHRIGHLLHDVGDELYRWTHSSSVDLAVTGLSRAGKTVFVTSLVHNLLCTGASSHRNGGSLDAFIPFTNGAIRAVMKSPSGERNYPQFPFGQCLTALASDSPSWPKRTGAASEFVLGLQFGRTKFKANAEDKAVATMTLRVVDYPGEWLLDLPLLDQSFEQWSCAAIALSREGSRAALSERWRAFLTERKLDEPNEDMFPRRAAEHYQDYLLECRGRGLRFLQPGRFLRLPNQDDEDARPILDRPQLWFCPLPSAPGGKWKSGSIGAAMAARYDAYCSETVDGFLRDTFTRFGRQLVLVDVLGALSAGEEAFKDTCRALSEVCRFLHNKSKRRWLHGSRIEKIAFAATKADHVPRIQRERLALLLADMLRDAASASRWTGTELLTTYLSSVCSTEEDCVDVNGQRHTAIVGRRIDTGKRAKVIINEIPEEVPDRSYWRKCTESGVLAFDFPTFCPPPINPNSYAGIPHIGMERLLNFLISDRFA